MTLPQNILFVLDRLNNAGFEAYIVGGCVRDHLMGRVPADYDITTSASPEQTLALFSDMHTLTYGMKHGTVAVMSGGEPVEITTFRRDGEYHDSRHPDTVYFDATLEQDLARRDFTCNAIAYSPAVGLVDIFGGREDIEKKIIRAVGAPEERFSEDALRIFRALRFSSVLGFEIESATAEAAVKSRALLDNVSGERLYTELCKLLCGDGCFDVIMKYPEILDRAVPGVFAMKDYCQHNPYHVYTLLEHTARVVQGVPAVPYMRLAALMHDLGKPDCRTVDENGIWHFHSHPERSCEIAAKALERLRCDGATRDKVLDLVRYHDLRFKTDEKMVLRWLGRLGADTMRDIFDIQQADISAQNPDMLAPRMEDLRIIRGVVDRAVEQDSCVTISALAVSGKDLLALGLPQGAQVGRLLKQLLEEVINGEAENERSALLSRAKELITSVAGQE